MTSIAFKGGTLAADTQVNSGNHCPCGHIDKIGRTKDGHLWAFAGSTQFQEACASWANGDRTGPLPSWGDDDAGVFILIHKNGTVREWWGGGWLETRCPDGFAWGSGEKVLRGAMLAGASAKKAVEIACVVDPQSGGEVQTLKL